ncbi:MAG: DUF2752 domain-containing protein [Dokdonella sp.]
MSAWGTELRIDRIASALSVEHRWLPLLTLVFLAFLVSCILLWFDPYAPGSILPPCWFHALTGLYCPGCGVTRALHALLHGHVGLAMQMNSLAVIAIPAIPTMLWNAARPGTAWMAKLSDARLWLLLVVAFEVLRNMPWQPFVWLAPG